MPSLIRIGNSQGVRIPKLLIKKAHLDSVELEFIVVEEGLLIKPLRSKPRQGWEAAIEVAIAEGADEGVDQEWLDAPLTKAEDGDWAW